MKVKLSYSNAVNLWNDNDWVFLFRFTAIFVRVFNQHSINKNKLSMMNSVTFLINVQPTDVNI